MELLLWIGMFLLWSVIKILTTAIFAVPAGFGLAAGFYFFKEWNNGSYVKHLEQEQASAAVLGEAE